MQLHNLEHVKICRTKRKHANMWMEQSDRSLLKKSEFIIAPNQSPTELASRNHLWRSNHDIPPRKSPNTFCYQFIAPQKQFDLPGLGQKTCKPGWPLDGPSSLIPQATVTPRGAFSVAREHMYHKRACHSSSATLHPCLLRCSSTLRVLFALSKCPISSRRLMLSLL